MIIGTMVFVVLGVLAAIGFFVYIGMKSPAQAVSANRKYLILTQSGHGLRPDRHHLHVDHVGLHLHAPDEPHHTAPPRSQEGVIIYSSSLQHCTINTIQPCSSTMHTFSIKTMQQDYATPSILFLKEHHRSSIATRSILCLLKPVRILLINKTNTQLHTNT